MKTRESVDFFLLGALMAGPRHGYEIMQFLEQNFGLAWYISTSQLYAVLKRIERKGWVASQVEIQETRPAKRVFVLSPAGRAHFLARLREPVRYARDMKIEFIGKLFFSRYLEQGELKRLIVSQEKMLIAARASLSERLAKEADLFKKTVLSSKLHAVDAWRLWLAESAHSYVKAGIRKKER